MVHAPSEKNIESAVLIRLDRRRLEFHYVSIGLLSSWGRRRRRKEGTYCSRVRVTKRLKGREKSGRRERADNTLCVSAQSPLREEIKKKKKKPKEEEEEEKLFRVQGCLYDPDFADPVNPAAFLTGLCH